VVNNNTDVLHDYSTKYHYHDDDYVDYLVIIIIRNLYSAIMPLGGYRGAGGTGR